MSTHQNFLVVFGLIVLQSFSSECARVTFKNSCGHQVEVVRVQLGSAQLQCNLQSGQQCAGDYNGASQVFKHGFGGAAQGVTLAEFTFNGWNNRDWYNLSLVDGFNVGMQIISNNGGRTRICRNHGCADAYLFPADNSKMNDVQAGGSFTIVFCP